MPSIYESIAKGVIGYVNEHILHAKPSGALTFNQLDGATIYAKDPKGKTWLICGYYWPHKGYVIRSVLWVKRRTAPFTYGINGEAGQNTMGFEYQEGTCVYVPTDREFQEYAAALYGVAWRAETKHWASAPKTRHDASESNNSGECRMFDPRGLRTN